MGYITSDFKMYIRSTKRMVCLQIYIEIKIFFKDFIRFYIYVCIYIRQTLIMDYMRQNICLRFDVLRNLLETPL